MPARFTFGLLLLWTSLVTAPLGAQPPANPADDDSILAGHSFHGEAFNQGPRQAAVLIPGMAKVEFPTSSESESAQQFFEQGIAQLHGFWYLEAERSFRQAAKADPDLAIAYWGMAMANVNNDVRARGFLDEAMKRRGQQAGQREKMYIEALDRLVPRQPEPANDSKPGPDGKARDKPANQQDKQAEPTTKQQRIERYITDLEKILHEFPDDLEARAFLVVQLWTADRAGVKLTSRYAVNALLGEIFAANPMHPAHHYRIHLWDSPYPKNALESAAKCGPASPGIAHMWHMPGHIYSKLHRYHDAAWQQEASARVDHAHMIRTRLMPDEIHNFAHNNEWLIRNLLYVGRVNDALDLSRNLVSMPRHPRYNSLKKNGSYKYGRRRLLQALTEYGLWNQLIDAAQSQHLGEPDDPDQRDELNSWLAVAYFLTGDHQAAAATVRAFRKRRLKLRDQLLELAEQSRTGDRGANDDKLGSPSRDALKKQIEQLNRHVARAVAAAATVHKDVAKLNKQADAAQLNPLIKAQWLADAGDIDAAIKLAEKSVQAAKAQVRPLAVLVDVLWRGGDEAAALKQFQRLRTIAGAADIGTPLLARLEPVAKAAAVDGDWRTPEAPANDLGDRPPLDELGPFRWQPYHAPSWTALTAAGDPVASEQYSGRPRILIFYLGFGCLHCVEQLHAFAPHIERFQHAGIDVLAISTESVEQLQTGIKALDQALEIPLLSGADQRAFKAFRVWDDFEDQPLHGTFLIDARDRVRWQDISYEPFTDVEFLLDESARLLSLPH